MAGIAEQSVDDTLKYVDVVQATLQSIIEDHIKNSKSRSESKVMKDFLNFSRNGGKMASLAVDSCFERQFATKLKAMGIPYVALSVNDQNKSIFLVKEPDVEKVNSIIEQFNKNQGLISEQEPLDFLKQNNGKDIGSYKGLSSAEVESFREQSYFVKLPFTVIKNEDKTFDVKFPAKYRRTAEKTLTRVNFNLTGKAGQTNIDRINWDIKNLDKTINTIKENPEKEYFVVSAYNKKEWIKVDEKGFDYIKSNQIISSNLKEEKDCQMNLYNKLREMDSPILLTKKEFEADKDTRDALVKSKNDRPTFSPDERKSIANDSEILKYLENKVDTKDIEKSDECIEFVKGSADINAFFEAEIILDDGNEVDKENTYNHIKETINKTFETTYFEEKITDKMIDDEILQSNDQGSSLDDILDKNKSTEDAFDILEDDREHI